MGQTVATVGWWPCYSQGQEQLLDTDSFAERQHVFAEHGASGSGACSTGKSGRTATSKCRSTVALDADTGEFLCEVTEPDQELFYLRGGRGGQGNAGSKQPPIIRHGFHNPASPWKERTIIWNSSCWPMLVSLVFPMRANQPCCRAFCSQTQDCRLSLYDLGAQLGYCGLTG